MKLKRRSAPDAEIEMTPMIDMVFLLLVFFMCAATMSKVDMTPEIALPVAPKSAVPDDLRNRGTINILPVGFQVAGQVVTEERPYMVSGNLVDLKALQTLVAEKHAAESDVRIYMRIDKEVEFRVVRKAIKACAEAGVFDIIFASYQSRAG